MKKNLLGWMTIALMAFVCVGFAACGSDDDDNGGGGANGITGMWKRTYKLEIDYRKNSSGQWEETSRKEKTYEDREAHGFLFQQNGKAESIYIETDGSYYSENKYGFDYKIEGGKLLMKSNYPGDTDGFEVWGAITFQGSTFELVEDDIDGNNREYELTRYQKVK